MLNLSSEFGNSRKNISSNLPFRNNSAGSLSIALAVAITNTADSFSENRELMEKDLIKAVSELVPLSRTAREQIDLLKEWSSSGRARSAS